MDADIIEFDEAKLRLHDHIVRGTAADGMIRAFAITGRETVQELSDRHHTSPVVTAALGRLTMAGQMMGVMSKNDDELLTLEVHGDGPVGGLTVTANNKGQAKGFANHPNVWNEARADGHLDVGGIVGKGTLSVIRDIPHIEPFSSTVELVSGEIGDDLTYYFAMSDQLPTSLGVGVLVNPDLSVSCAGGFLVQAMPGYDSAVIDCLERNLNDVHSVTNMLATGMGPSDMLDRALNGLDYQEQEVIPAEFHCGCNRERAGRAVMALGEQEIRDMVAKGEPAEVHCHFCGTDYTFEPAELEALLS